MTSSSSLDDLEDSFEIVDFSKVAEPQLSVEEQQTTVDEKKEDGEAETFDHKLEKLRKMELVWGFNVVSLFRYFLYLEICLALAYISYGDLAYFARFLAFPLMIFSDFACLNKLKARQPDPVHGCFFFTMLTRGLVWTCLCSEERHPFTGWAVYYLSTVFLEVICIKSLEKIQQYLGTVATEDKDTSAKLRRELVGPSLLELASRANKKIGEFIEERQQTTMNEEEKEKEENKEKDEEEEEDEEAEAKEFEKSLQELKGFNVVSFYHCCLYLDIVLVLGYSCYAFPTLYYEVDILDFAAAICLPLCLLWTDIGQLLELKTRRSADHIFVLIMASLAAHFFATEVMFGEKPKGQGMALAGYLLYAFLMFILGFNCATSLENIEASVRPLTPNDEDKLFSSLENETPYCSPDLARNSITATEKIEKIQ